MNSRDEAVVVFARDRIANQMGLEFRKIITHPDYYVSNRGHVISARRNRIRFLAISKSADGYHRALVKKAGELTKPKSFQAISRLILQEFVRHPNQGEQARHKNGIRHDNRTENLEWGTAKDNSDDRTRHGTQPIGVKNPNSKLSEQEVRLIRLSDESDRVLSKRHKISKGMIYYIRKGLSWKSVK